MHGPVYRRSSQAARRSLVSLAACVALAGALCPAAAWAFGSAGHRVAGHVAGYYLCAETRVALQPLLAGMTLAEAGLWPDGIRSDPKWQHSKPWHFINVSDRGSVARAARKDPDNVLAALARFEQELADRSLDNRQRGIALRFVAHFAADIHQPLHVGRKDDRGGNRVPLRVNGRETNLHALWDGEPLRQRGGPGPRDRARALPRLDAAAVRRLQAADPLDWARESQALRRQVYAFGPRRGREPAEPSADYLAAAREILDRRLLEAGVRLAGRLNAALGPPGGCTIEVASDVPSL